MVTTPFPWHPKDATQHAAQGDRIQTNEQLNLLMETIACGHTFMEPTQQVCW